MSFIVACVITGTLHAQHSSDMLWYSKPAINFNEALPVGNGRMGGMVYGRVQDEYISLNEQTLWSGGPKIRWNNPNAKKYLPLVRSAALNGEYKKADSLAKFMQGPYTESYMPMADMHILYDGMKDNITGYERSLNLDSAMAVTTFTRNAVTYIRSVFTSFPGNVMVIHNTANAKASISFTVKVASKLHYSIKVSGNQIILSGKAPQHVEPVYLWKIKDEQAIQYGDEGMTFQVNIKVNCKGGNMMSDDSSVTVLRADDATILVTAATSFNGYNKRPAVQGKNPAIAATGNIRKASTKTYTQLLQQHIADYKPFYRRVQYNFGDDANADMPTDERLRQMPDEFNAPLMATIVQYGRYLLIASSRAGGLPANLKGLWNEKLRPEYSANWCLDHDAQMFYYAAETNNLSEMHEPFLQFIKELSANGYITARVNYGMPGWCAHHNTDIWRKSSPVGNWGEGSPHWANWNMSGPWLCEHYFEHYLFTGDTSFLRKEAWPIMRGAALFCLHWLIPDGTDHLISLPSVSPENTFITEKGDTAMVSVNATGDIELMKDLFS
ncbi:MAG: glycoside hydrolase family 95 protein, partial [Mucilaginibacter sp.]